MFIKKFLILGIALFFSVTIFAQELHSGYQDGVVVFQLKQDIDPFQSHERKVNYQDYSFFKQLEEFDIKEVLQLLPTVKSEDLKRTFQINLTDPNEMDAVVEQLKKDSRVEFAEFKELHHSFATPNDPYYNQQWWLNIVKAAQAWDLSTGSSNVIVAVTDDGVNIDHPDLRNVIVGGYDAVNNTYNPYGCSGRGEHGTHVSGIIGAQTNNGTGVASIGAGVRVLPINVSDCYGVYVAGYEGVAYAVDYGSKIINMSWGGGAPSQYGQNVMNYAANNGAIPVAAAGNDNTSQIEYPAGYSNVFVVASTDSYDNKSGFSNYGNWIDIAAPGSNLLSTGFGSSYVYMSGTSMATPMVAGLLGLMKSYNPNASRSQLLNCITSSADPINDYYYQNGWMGHGRINARAALECIGGSSNPNPNEKYDVEVVDIAYPTGQIYDNTFVPEIKIRNNGTTNLTSFDLKYEAGGEVVTTTLEGSLAPGATSTTYGTPSISLNDGNYTLTATVSNPNGHQDENSANNTKSTSFRIGNTAPANDIAIVDIVYPKGQINENTFVPQIKIQNNGTTNLTSFDLKYEAGGKIVTTTLNGTLAPGASSTTYGTPSITLNDGQYTFTATVSNPNGQQDEQSSNNSMSSSFSIGNGNNGTDPNPNPDPVSGQVTLNIDTDCWGNETTWKVFDQNNNVVESGGPYASNYYYGNSYHHTLDLPAGCYTFTIYDSDGDGMNGSQYSYCYENGYYNMVDENGSQLFEMDTPNFGSSASHTFCIGGQSADGENPTSNADAGISQISSPGGTVLGSSISPKVTLKNYGSTTLNSVDIHYASTIDQKTYAWSGNLKAGKTTTISLPSLYVGNGKQNFKASTSIPNGGQDINPGNDLLEKTFTVYLSSYSQSGGKSIEESDSFAAYPNPTSGIVHLDWSLQDEIHLIEIVDQLGRMVKSIQPKEKIDSMELDLTDLSAGVYFIRLNGASKSYHQKIIKK